MKLNINNNFFRDETPPIIENTHIFPDVVLLLQDLHLVDLEDFKYAGTNLTAFRLVDPDNADVRVSQ